MSFEQVREDATRKAVATAVLAHHELDVLERRRVDLDEQRRGALNELRVIGFTPDELGRVLGVPERRVSQLLAG